MRTDQNAMANGTTARPSGVPKLKLNEIKLSSSQNKPSSKKDKSNITTVTTSNKMAMLESQTFSPKNSNGSLKHSNKMAAAGGSSRSTPDSAATNANRKTPPTSSGVSFAPQRTNSGDGVRLSSAGQNIQRVDYEQPMMTPRGGSYRDILVTPRGTTRSLSEQHIPSNRSSSRPNTTASTQKQEQQQQRALARASHEQTHVKQQISTLDAAIQAQQASLVDNIAVIQNLGTRRDRLANDAAALQAAVARAHAAASARQAEIQELEVLIESLQATLQLSQNNEEDDKQTTATTKKKAALMQLMQASARALRLPTVTLAIENELQKQQTTQLPSQQHQEQLVTGAPATAGRTATGTGTSRAVTARSDISTSRFVTPAGTGREGGEDHNDNDSVMSSSSSEEDSLDSSRTGIADDDVPLSISAAVAVAIGGGAAKGGNTTPSTSTTISGKLHRPGAMNVPLLQLPGTTTDSIPAHFSNNTTSMTQSSARLPSPNPQALARLQSIRSKLEVAEAILTARVPEEGGETAA